LPASIVPPDVVEASADIVPEMTRASEAVAQRAPGPRSPKKERARINAIAAAVAHAKGLWNKLVLEWDVDQRLDMLWAIQRSPNVVAAFEATVAQLDAVVSWCENTTGQGGPKDQDAPAGTSLKVINGGRA